MSQSLILIKPDAFQHRLVGWCIACFEPNIDSMYQTHMTLADCRRHYAEHVHKEFYPALAKHMTSGPIVALMVSHVDQARQQALAIRSHWPGYVSGPRNLVHASDSILSGQRELDIWFPKRPIRWNPYNKVVSDHRCGTVDRDATDAVRNDKGLPTPWSDAIAVHELELKPVF
jgi:nucleoside-diphosphate kinase